VGRKGKKIMGRNKASLAQDRTSSRGDYLIIVSSACHWAETIKQDPRFPNLGHVCFLSCPIILNKELFLAQVDAILRSKPQAHWKVIFAPPHGGEDGSFTMDTDAGINPDVPDWGNCTEWFKPLYALGIRRVHFHACSIGKFLNTLEHGKRGAGDDDPMIVTAWSRELWQYDEVGVPVTSDDYVFRGIPRCAAMRKGQKYSFNAIVEIGVTKEGVMLKRETPGKKR